ncbi:hypothetical protein FACS1894187_09640 [Synergistales bacterium]|nr:hypothetical protein FACS1894187_09640 [Synergistales bacterium]
MNIFDYKPEEVLGTVESVDTASVIVRVEDDDHLQGLQVNHLIAVQSIKANQHQHQRRTAQRLYASHFFAEKGKPTTAISTYAGLLWIYHLIGDMREMASPMKDTEGLRLAAVHEKKSIKSELDNDF